ncbi:hypothetical protein M0R45_001190 [Rubus argutus]|uniref:Uncharacterized protein n=1 Tax=Rubus argutus TaxID=59490 RepID=A0AAW1VMW7_RUBAR
MVRSREEKEDGDRTPILEGSMEVDLQEVSDDFMVGSTGSKRRRLAEQDGADTEVFDYVLAPMSAISMDLVNTSEAIIVESNHCVPITKIFGDLKAGCKVGIGRVDCGLGQKRSNKAIGPGCGGNERGSIATAPGPRSNFTMDSPLKHAAMQVSKSGAISTSPSSSKVKKGLKLELVEKRNVAAI